MKYKDMGEVVANPLGMGGYGRLYATADNLEIFRVKFTGAVMFLDYVHEKKNSTSGMKV